MENLQGKPLWDFKVFACFETSGTLHPIQDTIRKYIPDGVHNFIESLFTFTVAPISIVKVGV